jgi:Amt family ammonium transporter
MIALLKKKRLFHWLAGLVLAGSLLTSQIHADEAAVVAEVAEEAVAAVEDGYAAFLSSPEAPFFVVSNLWILVSAALVFIMHLGFSTVESGLTQSKNTVNILFKNLFIVCIGAISYMYWGFNAMYPGEFNGVFAMGSPIANGFSGEDHVANMTAAYASYTYWSDFIFQAMFAATAATIVSGAVAERVKLPAFMVYATLLVTFFYPITGSWEWGGGWLNGTLGPIFGAEFIDFAGSTLVHAFGGFAALGAVLVLGPRKGKYMADGSIRPILGHSMPLVAIGVFILFLGWFGFNGGSVLSADPEGVSRVFVTTAMSAFAGGLGAIAVSWILVKKPDLSMGLNGVLAGLVGITAGAGAIPPHQSVLVGLIAGGLVVLSVVFFDKIKIDDPVGAISVHGVCGVFGTLAVGIFGDEGLAGESISFMTQLVGTAAVSIFAFTASFALFSLIKVVMGGVRVSEEEEFGGLDIGEHGQEAYPDFGANSR